MKALRRSITFLLVAVMGFAFAGCGGKVVKGENIDTTKTQFYISSYDAGYGRTWLEMYKQKFEELYAEESFENGKKGVQVVINWNQDSGQSLISSMKMSENSIFFNSVNYFDLVNSGNAMKLDDIIKADLADFGEPGHTSEEKYYDDQLDYYKVVDGSVYAMPTHETYNGVSYDIDLWEERGFYFASEPGETNRWTTGRTGAAPKSKGPDGQENTYDDGMPATVDQFMDLLDKIANSGVRPFTFYGAYADFLTEALWYNFEGAEQIRLNYTFDGMAKNIVKTIDGSGNVTEYERDAGSDEGLTITDANAYKLLRQQGIYEALKVVKQIVDHDRTAANNRKYISTQAWEGDQTNLSAQDEYLYSNVRDDLTPVAMIIDGTYWQQEARSVFDAINNRYSVSDEYSMMNRRFGFMPMPFLKAEDVGTRKSTVWANTAIAFARAGQTGAALELTKRFFMMINTDDMLYEYLKSAGFPRSMKMPPLTQAQQDELTPFAKSLQAVKANSDLVYAGLSTNKFYLSYSSSEFQTALNRGGWIFNAGATGGQPIINMHNSNSLTPQTFFNNMYNNFESRWTTLYNRYYN